MTENPTPGTRKMSVTFERKKDLGDYQNVVARVWLEDEMPMDASDTQVSNRAVELLNAARAAACDVLGIEVFMDESGVLREKHEPVVSTQQAGANVNRNMPGSETFSTGGLKIMNREGPTQDVPQYIIDKCVEKGITAIWENDGQYGVFYKEAVSQGETPKIPDPKQPHKAGIIKSDS